MLDHAREAVSLVVRKERGDLDTDRVLQLALVRLIEIVGEAARRVSEETQTRHPQIPWPQVISTRNRLVHGYDFVDHDILWETITDDLPALIAQLEQIIQ
jgi:uncharacterized protein with HEPN domain